MEFLYLTFTSVRMRNPSNSRERHISASLCGRSMRAETTLVGLSNRGCSGNVSSVAVLSSDPVVRLPSRSVTVNTFPHASECSAEQYHSMPIVPLLCVLLTSLPGISARNAFH